MARTAPSVLQVAPALLEQWTLVRERRVADPTRVENALIGELAKAWDRRYDITEIIRVWEVLSTRDPRGRPCMCGSWGKLPLWAQHHLEGTAVTAELFDSDGVWTAVHCTLCNRRTTTKPAVSGESDEECAICAGVGLAPAWVSNAINFPWGAMDRVPEGGMWFPAPCAGCGGWGRVWPGEESEDAAETGARGETAVSAGACAGDSSVPQLERGGREWRVAFGGRQARIPHRVGLVYLAELIVRRDGFVRVMDLVAMRQPPPEGLRGEAKAIGLRETRGDDGLEVSDREALRSYHDRLKELDAEIDEADEANDVGRVALLHAEHAQILAELSAAEGLKGPRKASSTAERARQSVTKAISESIELIGKHLPALGQHLRLQVDMGQQVRYRTVSGK